MFSGPEPRTPNPGTKLTNPSTVLRILRKNNIRLDKGFGQHFLVDENIRRKIIDAADIRKDDIVLEIGPGIGTLSQQIADKAVHLWLIELEKRFIPILKKTVIGKNVEIIQGDAMKIDLAKLEPKPNKVVSNLPYNIAAPLIMKILVENPHISKQVLMVQQEMAARLTAKVDSREYNALTVKASSLARITKLFTISEQVFLPKPKVRSAVLQVVRYPSVSSDKWLFALIEAAFNYRRKTIKNALVTAGFEREKVESALEKAGIEAKERPQNLTLDNFRSLALIFRGIDI